MKKFIVTAMVALMLLVSAAPVLAAVGDIGSGDALGVSYGESLGLGNRDIRDTIATVIRAALGLLGIVAVAIILMGGFTWLTSAGSAEKVKSGTQTIIWAAIGAAVTLSSYIILNTILSLLAGK